MNEKQKFQWIDALRSGKFNQCRNYLKVESKDKDNKMCHCSLGVGAELFIPDKFMQRDSSFYNFWGIDNLFAELKAVTGMNKELFLAVMGKNDSGGSFEEVAQLIENFEGEAV